MKIAIEASGHHVGYSVEGEVIEWCQTVENYDGKYLQVPAVIVNTKDGIEIVSLAQRMYQIKVKIKGE